MLLKFSKIQHGFKSLVVLCDLWFWSHPVIWSWLSNPCVVLSSFFIFIFIIFDLVLTETRNVYAYLSNFELWIETKGLIFHLFSKVFWIMSKQNVVSRILVNRWDKKKWGKICFCKVEVIIINFKVRLFFLVVWRLTCCFRFRLL